MLRKQSSIPITPSPETHEHLKRGTISPVWLFKLVDAGDIGVEEFLLVTIIWSYCWFLTRDGCKIPDHELARCIGGVSPARFNLLLANTTRKGLVWRDGDTLRAPMNYGA